MRLPQLGASSGYIRRSGMGVELNLVVFNDRILLSSTAYH